MGRKDSLPADAPAIRLCEMVKWPHFQGYGFNLHSEKGKEGQFVGKIDPASPAEACGLLEGDQIVEVNGVNTSNENHKQVVERIKTDPDHVSLLVVDQVAAEFYKKRGVVINGSLSSVKTAARSSSTSAGQDQETGESETSSQTKAAEKAAEKKASVPKEETPRIDTTLQVEGSGSDRAQPSPAPSADSTGTVESAKSAESTKSSGSEPDKFGLKLNMSAAEMREYLKSKKRHDPRNDNLSFKQRHEIVQNM